MLYPVMTESRMFFDLSGIWTFKMKKVKANGNSGMLPLCQKAVRCPYPLLIMISKPLRN